METITQEMIDEGWENFSNKIEETFEKAKLKKETKMENHRLSLIEVNGFLLSGTPKQTLLALDGKEIPGQVGIRQIASDRRGFKIVTVTFNVPDKAPLAERDPREVYVEYEFNKIRSRVYKLYNRVIYGVLRGSEEVAKEMGGLTVGYSEYGINKISLMTDIANFAFKTHPRILWGITEKDIKRTGDPTLEFRGVDNKNNAHCPVCGALEGDIHKPFCSGIGDYCG